MDIIQTSIPNYTIKTDYHPYDDAKKIIAELDWWQHPNRTNTVRHKPNNYSLDTNLVESLGRSFEERLKNGCFSFVYYHDELVAYCGLRISDQDAYVHRMTTSPNNHLRHFGIISRTIFPLHIKIARSKGCKTYSVTVNDEHIKFVNWWKEGHYKKSKFMKIQGGGDLVSNFFEFRGVQKIYGIDQHVMTLDLTRSDLDEILPG